MNPLAIDPAVSSGFETATLRELVVDIGATEARGLLRTLLVELPKRARALASAESAADLPVVVHHAHVLKGMGMTFGARLLAEYAQQVELAGRAGDSDTALPLCRLLRAEVDATVALLAAAPPWLREALS